MTISVDHYPTHHKNTSSP